MKPRLVSQKMIRGLVCCIAASLLASCATTDRTEKAASNTGNDSGQMAAKYLTTDRRTIEIGRRSAAEGGWNFKDPHLEKCWLAEQFNFTGYDTLYIAPTISTAMLHGDDDYPHQLAKENLAIELNRSLGPKNIFANIVTRESDIKPGARILKLENTIVEYAKGGGAARFWAGLYGAGQPMLRVQGKMTDGDKVLFTYQARRSGVSAGARLSGGYQRDETIQLEDIRSMVLDLTDFMAAIAGKYQAK